MKYLVLFENTDDWSNSNEFQGTEVDAKGEREALDKAMEIFVDAENGMVPDEIDGTIIVVPVESYSQYELFSEQNFRLEFRAIAKPAPKTKRKPKSNKPTIKTTPTKTSGF